MKLLVAVDQSEYSQRALERAIAMSKAENAELLILTIDENMNDFADFSPGVDVQAKMREFAREIMNKALEKAKAAGVNVSGVVLGGISAASAIIDYAREQSVDMIITGSRGKSAIESFLLGGVAQRVVQHAPCSVLVVR